MKKVNPTIQAGFMELLPKEQKHFDWMADQVRETYKEFGFDSLDTVVIENEEVLLARVGEDTKKEIYKLEKGEDKLALRFDLTVPLARFVAMNWQKLAFPFRRFQIGKVYRGEKPQKGRFRELYQADIDIVGSEDLSLTNDAEIVAVMNKVFERLALGEFVIRINNRKILTGLASDLGVGEKIDDILRIVDKIEKIGESEVRRELGNLSLNEEQIGMVIDFVKINGDIGTVKQGLIDLGIKSELFVEGMKELFDVVEMSIALGVPTERMKLDLSIARGLAYYTGTVFEINMEDSRIKGSVCGGGRYDDLAESFTDKKFPGVGASIGLTRLFSQIVDLGFFENSDQDLVDVVVVPYEVGMDFPLKVVKELRDRGIRTLIYGEGGKMKKGFSYADRIGAKFVAVIGETEVEAGKVMLKDMLSGEQTLLSIDEVIGKFSN